MTTLSNERMGQLTDRLLELITQGASYDTIVEFVDREGPADLAQVYTVWVLSSVAMFNVMAPIEAGMALTAKQLAGANDMVTRYANGRATEGTMALKDAFAFVSRDQDNKVGEAFARVWADEPYSGVDMLVAAVLIARHEAHNIGVTPSRLARRASELRAYLVETRTALKKGHWCASCLTEALKVAALTDDRDGVGPVDSKIGDAKDTSFLAGIKLEEEHGT